MQQFTKHTLLADIIFQEPSVIAVINRFGIYLGVGNMSVEQSCLKHGIEPDFLLALLNTYIFDSAFPPAVLESVGIDKIVDYLSKANVYYREFQLPNIERHFNSLIRNSESENSNLSLLKRFFIEMKQELLAHIDYDTNVLFPALLEGKEAPKGTDYASYIASENDITIDKIDDLLSFFVVHLSGEYDHNLCRAVVSTVFTLAKDLRQNNRIRRKILLPMAKRDLNHAGDGGA